MNQPLKVDDGQVVSMHYTLHVDGQLIDTSTEGEPLEFIQGMGQIIPGLEQQLYNMQVGETRQVTVAPRDGYGEVDLEAFMDVPRSAFPANIPVEKGVELELRDQAGHPLYARIDAVTEENVRLDMNHPLAGKELHFEVTIAALRPATEDEMAHGHVHSGKGDH